MFKARTGMQLSIPYGDSILIRLVIPKEWFYYQHIPSERLQEWPEEFTHEVDEDDPSSFESFSFYASFFLECKAQIRDPYGNLVGEFRQVSAQMVNILVEIFPGEYTYVTPDPEVMLACNDLIPVGNYYVDFAFLITAESGREELALPDNITRTEVIALSITDSVTRLPGEERNKHVVGQGIANG